MNAFDFASKHPFLTFFLVDGVVVNICKVVNNIAAYKMLGKDALVETVMVKETTNTEEETIEE